MAPEPNFHQREKQSANLIKEFERLVAITLACLIALGAALYFWVLPSFSTKTTTDFFQSIVANLISASCVFLASFVFLRRFYAVKGDQVKHQFSQTIDDLFAHERRHQEIESIAYSNIDTNWRELLTGASEAHICVFYLNHEWEQKNFSILLEFAKAGGNLFIYLPNPLTLSGRFFGSSTMGETTTHRIIETYVHLYFDLRKVSQNIQILFSDKGFNFMFARVIRSDGTRFLFSPYPNVRPNSPSIVINEARATSDFAKYAALEVDLLVNSSTSKFNFEEEGFITWSKDSTKVFVSSELACSANCSFCFVDSLKSGASSIRQSPDMARLFCMTIETDERFRDGREGTTIMLGGHTDPFLPRNLDFSIEFLQVAPKYFQGNIIHAATRFSLGERRRQLAQIKDQLVVNYSISTFDDSESERAIEPKNQLRRFEDAKSLILDGFKVALFIRPIIKDRTLKDLPRISKAARDAGINIVTVGGLYVDVTIRKRLAELGIDNIGTNYEEGSHHVLDSASVLKKIKNNDVSLVRRALETDGFTVFANATERIKYFQ